MTKNIKKIFFVLTLITLLATVGAVCAADDANTTTTTTDNSVSDVASVSDSASDTVAAELATTSNDNKVDTKTIEKEEKNLKTSTKTVEVHDYDEFKTAMNNAVNDENNNDYIINLNPGTYTLTNTVFNKGSTSANIIINGNNQTLDGSGRGTLNFTNDCNITINNITINCNSIFGHTKLLLNNFIGGWNTEVWSYNDTTLINSTIDMSKRVASADGITTIENSSIGRLFNQKNGSINVINSVITGNMVSSQAVNQTMIIDNCTFNSSSNVNIGNSGSGATLIIKNTLINKFIDNYANLIINNSTIDARIRNRNNANLTIDDNTIFTENCTITNNGELFIDDINRIIPYYDTYNGEYTLENITITYSKTNNGNLTLKNTIINSGIYNYNANLTLINCTINSPINGDAKSTIIIDDNCVFNENATINWNGVIITNDTGKLAPYLGTYDGNYTLENVTINKAKTNKGILYINNATINSQITNNNQLYIDCSNITQNGQLLNYNNMHINNSIINAGRFTTNGTLDITNSIINSNITITNNASICNSTINSTINNDGLLIVNDDTIFGENTLILGSGSIIINDSSRIAPYLEKYNGNYTIKDTPISSTKYNYGNLSIINSTINGSGITNYQNANLTAIDSTVNAPITNQGTFITENSTLNSLIINTGTLIIDDNTSISDEFMISGTGAVYTNNTDVINKLKEYGILIGENTIENTVVDYTITNNGQLTLKNSTLNSSIVNYGMLIIDDDCIIGERCTITGNGQLIINDIMKVLPYISVINGTYTIENIAFNRRYTFAGNITLNNCTISGGRFISITNYDFLYINNSTVNMTSPSFSWLINYGVVVIDNNTEIIQGAMANSGDIFYGQSPESINPIRLIGDNTYENMLFNAKSTNYGNTVLINCSITKHITNQGNLTLINCSLSNNNMTVSDSNIEGFLIKNEGNLNMVGCVVENNTFNTTAVPDTLFYLHPIYGAIVNDANMSVDGCIFRDNRVGYQIHIDDGSYYGSDSRFGSASCIYNIGTLSIKESLFENNYAGDDGGAILSKQITQNTFDEYGHFNGTIVVNDGSVIIDNTQLINNTAKQTDASLSLSGSYNLIENSTITDTIKATNLTLNNNTINSEITAENLNLTSNIIHTKITAINLTAKNNTLQNGTLATKSITDTGSQGIQLSSSEITNNTFTTQSQIAVDDKGQHNIHDNIYLNASIYDQLTLNIPDNIIAGEQITITGTYSIRLPERYDPDILEQNRFLIYINDELVDTTDTLEFTITPTNGTMIVTVQPSISSTRKTEVIRTSIVGDLIITPENYNEYIYEGELVGVSKDSKIIFQGTFNNKGEVYIDTPEIIIDGTDAIFTNTIFTLDASGITLQNMKITNTETTSPIANYQDNNIIANNILTLTNTETTTSAIYNQASNTLIENNTITMQAPANDIDFSSGEGVASTQAILLLGGDKNTVRNNTINIKCTQATSYNTLEAITNNNGATNTLITQNKINISDANFNYAIDSINNVENITITENTITATGERYCDGVQTGNNARNILVDNNNITCICINTTVLDTEGAITYGIIGTMLGGNGVNNMTITNNNINLTGTANYGIELYFADTTEIHNNNIIVNGPYSMGIGYAYSPNGNATQNTITITGDSTTPINQITEEFKPENVGIRIQNGTTNISLTDNTITTSDVGGQDTTIHTDPDNVTIANNQLTSSNGYGDETIIAPTTANIEDNLVETITTFTVDDVVLINSEVSLTATVYDEFENTLNGGSVSFTIGNEVIAQVEVVDGTATTTISFTEAQDATIVASYTPVSSGLATSSAEASISIQEAQTVLNIEEVDLTAGENVTLNATLKDQLGNNINGGKVIFKINGKTIKDANGKIVYAKVVDGVASVEYAVPTSFIGKTLNISAVYSGCRAYDSARTNYETSVEATAIPTLTITPLSERVESGSNITIQAKVSMGETPITTGKIIFKINGKTIKNADGKIIYAKVDSNGCVSVDYNIGNLKAKDYTLEAVFMSSGYDKLTSNTTLSVKE